MSSAWTIKSLVILSSLAAGLICLDGCKEKEAAPTTPSPVVEKPAPPAAVKTEPAATAKTAKTAETKEAEDSFKQLKGRWLRPDGGYVLDIRSIDSDGKLNAGYFNPNPINVSEAKASKKNGSAEVFVELRDTNYPGSTYTLTYVPQQDVLIGKYFQAVEGQTFEVLFIRQRQFDSVPSR